MPSKRYSFVRRPPLLGSCEVGSATRRGRGERDERAAFSGSARLLVLDDGLRLAVPRRIDASAVTVTCSPVRPRRGKIDPRLPPVEGRDAVPLDRQTDKATSTR
jgi:hypothetical protein